MNRRFDSKTLPVYFAVVCCSLALVLAGPGNKGGGKGGGGDEESCNPVVIDGRPNSEGDLEFLELKEDSLSGDEFVSNLGTKIAGLRLSDGDDGKVLGVATGNPRMKVFLLDSDGTLSSNTLSIDYPETEGGPGAGWVEIGDVNADSVPDIVISSPYLNQDTGDVEGRILVYLGTQTGSTLDFPSQGVHELRPDSPVIASSSYGDSLAIGDIDTTWGGNEIVVADPAGAGRVDVFFWFEDEISQEFRFAGSITNPSAGSDDLLGSAIEIGSDKTLYVSARLADSGKTRDAGIVYRIPQNQWSNCQGDWSNCTNCEPLTRNRRNEQLGRFVAVGDFLGGNEEDVIAGAAPSPGKELSVAVFDGDTGYTLQPEDLVLPSGTGPVNDSSAAAFDGDGADIFLGTPTPGDGVGGKVWVYQNGDANSIAGCPDYVLSSPDQADGARFGWGIKALDANGSDPGILIVGERTRDSDGDGTNEGRVYIYTFTSEQP